MHSDLWAWSDNKALATRNSNFSFTVLGKILLLLVVAVCSAISNFCFTWELSIFGPGSRTKYS